MAIIKCPECEGTLSSSAKQCIHCGADLTVCPECETAFVGNISVCPECGFEMSLKENQEKKLEMNSKRKTLAFVV